MGSTVTSWPVALLLLSLLSSGIAKADAPTTILPHRVPAATSPPSLGFPGGFIFRYRRPLGVGVRFATANDGNRPLWVRSTPGAAPADVEWMVRSAAVVPITDAYAVPRAGTDFALDNGITVGASVAFMKQFPSSRQPSRGVDATSDVAYVSALTFAPRGGYFLAASSTVSIWFKGGLTFSSFERQWFTACGDSQTTHARKSAVVSLDLLPELVILPAPQLGLTIGPLLSVPLAGYDYQEVLGPDVGWREHLGNRARFGVRFGILGRL